MENIKTTQDARERELASRYAKRWLCSSLRDESVKKVRAEKSIAEKQVYIESLQLQIELGVELEDAYKDIATYNEEIERLRVDLKKYTDEIEHLTRIAVEFKSAEAGGAIYPADVIAKCDI